MEVERSVHSRRAVLAASIGSAAAVVAGLFRPGSEARAAAGDPVLIGEQNTGNGTTYLLGSPLHLDRGLIAENTANINAVGVTGIGSLYGVYAYSESKTALIADGGNTAEAGIEAYNHRDGGVAIRGEMTTPGVGVFGRNYSGGEDADSCGVWGEGGTRGVQGTAVFGGIGVAGAVHNVGPGSASDPRIQNGPANAGVYGWGLVAGTSTVGVGGSATDGNGVSGHSNNGTGVHGYSGGSGNPWPAAPADVGVYGHDMAGGRGVWGHSPSGSGVYCTTSTGNALRVNGKSRFSRSGKTSVPAGKLYVDVTVPGGIASNTVLFATMQTYRAGVAIAAMRPNYPSTGKARIYLTKVGSSSASTSVAWIATEYGA